MASQADHSLPNKFCLYIGDTGSGKSQALKQLGKIPGRGVRCLMWDPGEDHKAQRCTTLRQFERTVAAGIRRGGGFRIALTLPGLQQTAANHELWCSIVYQVLNGRRLTYVIDEELSAVTRSAGKADPALGLMLNQGRKFGLVYHGTIQYPQELSKTVYRACQTLFVGIQDVEAVRYVARRLAVEPGEIARLKPLQFIKSEKHQPNKTIQMKYKKMA
ncbi:MAG: hypothetical protein AB9Q19_00450 [Candidatus Reddybacter sp.]